MISLGRYQLEVNGEVVVDHLVGGRADEAGAVLNIPLGAVEVELGRGVGDGELLRTELPAAVGPTSTV